MDADWSTDSDANAEAPPAFDAQWQSPDTVHLAPSKLAVARARRAWERKALSPRDRDCVRVGKVWKRADAPARKMRFAKLGADSPLRAVKRLRVDEERAEGSKWEWEVRGKEEEEEHSPVRKIVTRSARQDSGLVELEEEEEEETAGEVTVEVFDEHGDRVEVVGEHLEGTEAGWSDVEEEEEDEQEEAADGTMMHLPEAIAHLEPPLEPTEDRTVEHIEVPPQPTVEADVAEQTARQAQLTKYVDTAAKEAREMDEGGAETGVAAAEPLRSRQATALPDGFVTPMKQRRKLGPRSLRIVSAARRQTLPVQFAPGLINDQLPATCALEEMTDAAEGQSTRPLSREDQSEEVVGDHQSLLLEDGDAAGDNQSDGDWEDAETGEAVEAPSEARSEEELGDGDAAEGAEDTSNAAPTPPGKGASLPASGSTNPMLSRPMPTIEGPHPRLPLRRSPRRQSTSPRKHSTSTWDGKPHFLAFTPVQRPSSSVLLPDAPATRSPCTEGANMAALERASSAPPGEPQSTPRPRSARPRISDDTALLQAFLNRAEQNRSSRRLSATEKEALTNRRDSDTVRQALASPAALKPDVLADLDPNSPIPRKSPANGEEETAQCLKTAVGDEPIKQEEDEDTLKTTRSGRRRKKPPVFSQSTHEIDPAMAPSKITIRGTGANGVDLKRTEAQELAMLTKNNTRKNKSGCVLPRARLLKLEGEMMQREGERAEGEAVVDVAMVEEVDDGRRRVRWAEILTAYRDGSELSDHSDEPQERMPWERGADFDPTLPPDHGTPAPPPPADTPSKPRVRRLRAPKTCTAASAPAAGVDTAAVEDRAATEDDKNVGATKKKAAPKLRKSRLATPAKAPNQPSPPVLLPSHRQPENPAVAPAVPRPATTTKKRSRLPGPATKITAGKEHDAQPLGLTIASPPKKRPASALSATKSFAAPKLEFAPQLRSASSEGGGAGGKEAGLSSPPKKRSVRAMPAAGSEDKEIGRVGESGMGMKSPAKKRGRRVG